MQRKLLLFALLLLLTFHGYSQKYIDYTIKCNIPKSNSEDITEVSGVQNIITTLYQGHRNSKNECVWKPDYEERIGMGISDDGYLYSKLEDTITYKTSYSEVILLIVGTYTKTDGDYSDCIACSPAIGIIKLEKYNEDQYYKVTSFRKNVTSYSTDDAGGGMGGISLIDLGNDVYVLEASQSQGQGGYNNTFTTLLSTEGDLLLSIESEADNEGSEKGGFYKNETNMVVDKSKGIITLHKTGTELKYLKGSVNAKVVTVNKITKYQITESGALEAISN